MIDSLSLLNIRNLAQTSLTQGQLGLVNVFYGNNGSGKTSLLEAIHMLGHGKSFKESKIQHVINHNQDQLTLFGTTIINTQVNKLGIERHRTGETRLRINSKDTKSCASLANHLPLQIIAPHSFQLLEGGPQPRREYIDWGTFHVKHEFITEWRAFNRVLKQRNAALKDRSNNARIWDKELEKSAKIVHNSRQYFVDKLLAKLPNILKKLLNIDIDVKLISGWDSSVDYSQALENSYAKDQILGYTTQGPHRADLGITINEIPVHKLISRGQEKLLICALKIAQSQLVEQHKQCIYLIDDLPSELDDENQGKIFKLLAQQKSQLFITAVEKRIVDVINTENNVKLFHVEHGVIKTVSNE